MSHFPYKVHIGYTLIGLNFFLAFGDYSRLQAQDGRYDIREFGARCDGSDDSAAVNTALRALPNGGTLIVPCRAGIGPAGILLRQRDEVTIEGVDGGGFLALAENASRTLFEIEQCDRCSVRKLFINGQGRGVVGIRISNSKYTKVEDNQLVNIGYPASAAIVGVANYGNNYLRNSIIGTGVLYSGTTIVDGTRGIWLGPGGDTAVEWDAVITGNSLSQIGATAIAINGVGPIITGNTVDTTNGAGIKVSPPRGKGSQTVVEGNTLRRNLFHGVQIDNADSAVFIRKNTLVANTISGIYISGGAFVNGQIIGNTIIESGQVGIYIYDADRVLIQQNYIFGRSVRPQQAALSSNMDLTANAGNGIVFEARYVNAIQNVQLDGNTITSISGNGVALRGRGGTIRNLIMQANAMSDNLLYGVAIDEQLSGSIQGATLVANCFANNGKGTLLDARTFNPLIAPSAAPACPAGAPTAPVSASHPSSGRSIAPQPKQP